jgi:Domain of unknown function DUF29
MTDTRYERDFYAWTQAQATALRAKDWAALNVGNLAEEIDSLGRSDRRAVTHELERLLTHLLKWAYQPEQRPRYGRSWSRTLLQARTVIGDLIEESPSLQDYPSQRLTLAYRRALRLAANDTGLPLAAFRQACPWSLEQILDEDFLPEG